MIRTALSLDRRRWPIEVTLADRTEMGFDVILGRTAIRRRGLVVDPGRSFLTRAPKGFMPPDADGEDETTGSENAPEQAEDAPPAREGTG